MSEKLRKSYRGESWGELTSMIGARLVPGNLVSCRFGFLGDDDAMSPPMTDPTYLPAWMYLGRVVRPASIVEYGCGLGLASGSVCLGYAPDMVLTIQADADIEYNWRLAQANVSSVCPGEVVVHTGGFFDDEFQSDLSARSWDLAIVNVEDGEAEGLLGVMSALRECLARGGLLAVDFVRRNGPAQMAFEELCRSRSMEPAVLATRYGIGLLQKD